MKKKLSAVLITAAMLATYAYASPVDTHDLGRRSMEVSYQLNRIAEQNRTDLCAGDITIAAAYIESAARELSRYKIERAIVSLTYGQNELNEISHTRSYCARLSTSVKPYLAKIILIKSEVELNIRKGQGSLNS